MRRVLFLVSANNGLTQRAAAELRTHGHRVRTEVVSTAEDMLRAAARRDFDLIVCPYLKARIPDAIWRACPTVIIHPGPVGDQGPSSLDWAIAEGLPVWGVTALSAVAELDGGPIWAWRTFEMPRGARKSDVYNGPVADAAVACVLDVVAKSADPSFRPIPRADVPRMVLAARARPRMTQADRAVSWAAPAADIVRAVAAADGAPGLRTTLQGVDMFVYDARADAHVAGEPGPVVAASHGAVRVAAGTGSVWIGHARVRGGVKLPAAHVLSAPAALSEATDIRYRRVGRVGVLEFDFYNGAMSTEQCERLLAALRVAKAEPTKVLALLGGWTYFSNGIHLNVIEAATNPAAEAWRNIKAINAVCREIIACEEQVVMAAFTGNAGAGGVMLPLGADVVVARAGVVLNPHYATMGLYGSELHTYTLPRRVGATVAKQLTSQCLPIGAAHACEIGLVDAVGPRDPAAFVAWLSELADSFADGAVQRNILSAKREVLAREHARRPLDAYEAFELGEMARDMFENRCGFAEKRHAFVRKLSGGGSAVAQPRASKSSSAA